MVEVKWRVDRRLYEDLVEHLGIGVVEVGIVEVAH